MCKYNRKPPVTISLLLILLFIVTGCGDKYHSLDTSAYKYRDTKQLVTFVYDAALKVEKDGMSSIDYFKANRELYKQKDYYLYIYDMEGNNVFHAGMEYLEGCNLMDVTDNNGKKITRLVLHALEDSNNPHAWVHYTWWEPGNFYPIPKSSCHFKVTTPEGKELYVGGGMDYPHEEKEFIRIIVDDAIALINEKNEDALNELIDPTSLYIYRDVRVFVFKPNGEILISPVINDNMLQLQLLECTDETGHKPFVNALAQLENSDRVWQVFMARSRYQRTLVKKVLYVRKTLLNGEEICIGAVTDLPQPPY